jgi:hypothetical protein
MTGMMGCVILSVGGNTSAVAVSSGCLLIAIGG